MIDDILDSIKELSKRAGISHHKAFTAWYAMNFHDLDEDEALSSAAMDGGNDNGIDLVFGDDLSKTIYILQGHCGDNHSKQTPKGKWSDLLAAIPFYENTKGLKDAGRIELAEQIEIIKSKFPDYKVAFGLVSLGLKNASIVSAVSHTATSVTFSKFQLYYSAQEDILNQYKGLIESESGIAEDTLTFVGDHIQDSGEYGRAWIGNVSASELIRLNKAYPSQLFAGNVRLFLGNRKGGINEQIIKTAKNSPGLFWALNNGISIIADTATPLVGKENTLTLRRFSIVNGCQTTSSLTEANADDSCKVLLRVIAARDAVKNDVVRFNNSQNAIKIWTVRAVDGIQERLRRDFDKLGLNYAPKQAGSRRKRDTSKIVELDRLAQYLAAQQSNFLIQAIDNKAELFDKPYSELFYPQISSASILLAWSLGNICEEKRIEQLEDLEENSPAAGLLSVTSTFWIIFVAYKILKKYSDLNSSHITVEKIHTPAFRVALAKQVDFAVEFYYLQAVDTYGDGTEFRTYKSALRSTKFLQLLEPKIDFKITQLGKSKTGKPSSLENVAKNIKL